MKQTIAVATLMLCCSFVHSQDMRAIENKLVNQYNKVTEWAFKTDDESKYDSVEKFSAAFEKSILSITKKYPQSLKYNFARLDSAGVSVSSSDDGLFRIYSWDTWTGGTMHMFTTIFQYASGNKTISVGQGLEEGDAGAWHDKLYSLHTLTKTWYLSTYHGVYSGRDKNVGIQCFAIENGKLNPKVKLIKTGSGMNNTLDVPFDVAGLGDTNEYPEITYDEKTQSILLPLLDGNGKLTKKHIVYKFNGSYFEKLKK